ncbi:MAG TPA: hypothetical protein VNO81_11725, partial [Candidatus Nitrosotenuis sp.]|nr:hypothetical protein [Candidatus Nitrosotenuis sp.]
PRLPLAPARYEADNLNNQALLALDRGAPGEQALEMLEQALARQPDHPQALVNQALLAWELGLVTTAAALEALPPGRHPARLWLLAQTGEPERALEELLAPGNAWSFNLRGVLLHQLDRPGQALTDFEGAVQLLPQQWQYQHNLGVALSRAGEKEKALVHLERAASLTSDPLPAVSYAVTLAGQGRAREARSVLQKVHEQHPESAWLNYHLGALYAGMGLRVPGADGLKPLLKQAREHLLAAYRAAPTLHRVGEALRECNRRMEIQEDLPEAAPDARPHRRLGCLWTARLARVFSGHKEGVVGITMSWDGRYFISAGLDDTVRVWDPLKGEVIATLRGHAAGVRSLAISADGTLLLSGSDDSTARLWQLPKGPALHVLRGHQGEVWAVALSYDGGTALTGGTDRRVRVWDARSGDLRHALEGHRNSVTALAVSYDGLMAVSGSVDGTLRVWDLRGGVELGSLETPEEIYSLALSFDGRRVLTGGSESVLRLWDLESGQCLHELAGHENEIRCVSMSPDGRFALSGGWDRTVRLWDLGVGECIRVLRGHEHQVTAVYACPDNRFGFSGSLDKSIRMWEWKEELLPLLPGPPPLQWAGPERVEKLAMGEVLWADTLQRARAEMAAGRWKQACSLLRRAQTLPGRRQDPEILDLLEDCGRHGRRSGLRQGWCLGVLRGHSDWVRAVAV